MLCVLMFSVSMLNVIMQNGTQHCDQLHYSKYLYDECHVCDVVMLRFIMLCVNYAECHYADCRGARSIVTKWLTVKVWKTLFTAAIDSVPQ
jgi:hypothetical protein